MIVDRCDGRFRFGICRAGLLGVLHRDEFGFCRNQGDLEYLRPELSGDKEPVVSGVVRDAVEHGFVVGELAARHQAFEIDPADDTARCWRDAGDAIGVPDVGVDFAVDVFEFVEFLDWLAVVFDGDAAGFVEGFGIEEAQGRGAVAEDEDFAS